MTEITFNPSLAGSLSILKDGDVIDDILPLWVMADMGDISNMGDVSSRTDFWQDMYGWDIYEKGTNWPESFADDLKDSFDRLLKLAGKGEDLRIWWSDTAEDTCGLYLLLWLLKEKPCNISGIKIPMVRPLSRGTFRTLSNIGEILPDELEHYLMLERSFNKTWRNIYAARWLHHSGQNTPLRANINGLIHSVPDYYYDFALNMALDKLHESGHEEYHVARVLGEALGNGPVGVRDVWYAKRLRKYIDFGWLTITEESDVFQSCVVKPVK